MLRLCDPRTGAVSTVAGAAVHKRRDDRSLVVIAPVVEREWCSSQAKKIFVFD
jgi:hypothetical protein